MSNNYSKLYLRSGKIEITIEGDANFVFERYREIFRLPNEQSNSADEEVQVTPEKSEELSEAHKVSASSGEEKKDQSSKGKTTKSSEKTTQTSQSETPASPGKVLNALGSDFGDWLAYLPNSAELRDKILMAAYFKQKTNSEHKFYIRGIRALLKEYEISVSSLSNFLDTFEIQKIISKVAEISRKGYQFTKEGEKYIEDLLASQINT